MLDSYSRLTVASFGMKSQLCQLNLKTTHEPKQDIRKNKSSQLPNKSCPALSWCFAVCTFLSRKTDFTTLCTFCTKWMWTLPPSAFLYRQHTVCKGFSFITCDIIFLFAKYFCLYGLSWPPFIRNIENKQIVFVQTIHVCHVPLLM